MTNRDAEPTRSARQRKPRYRLRNIVLFVIGAIAVFIGYVTYETVALMNAEPNPMYDYREAYFAEVLKTSGADPARAQEAYDLLTSARNTTAALWDTAYDRLEDASNDGRYVFRYRGDALGFHFGDGLRGPSVHAALDRERTLLAEFEQADVFETLERFVALAPAIDQTPREGVLLELTMPWLSRSRSLVKVLVFRARLAMESGDQASAVASFEATFAMSQALANEESLIARLVATACNTLALRELANLRDEHEFSEESCARLIDAMDRFELPPVQQVLHAEKIIFQDWVQHSFSDDGAGGGYLQQPRGFDLLGMDSDGEPTIAEAFVMRFFGPERADMMDAIDAHFAHFAAELDKKPIERFQNFDRTAAREHRTSADRMLEMVMPAIEKSLESELIHSVQWCGVQVALHVERFRARHGRDPESLTEVETTLGLTLPVDPLHGGSFGYRRLDAPDEHGRTYLVYATGFDGTDDGGTEASQAEHVDWYLAPLKDRYTSSGFDFIINRPRESWPEDVNE